MSRGCARSRIEGGADRPFGSQVWTSEKQLQGREFCFIFNELVRNDELLEGDVAEEVANRRIGA